MRCGSSNLPSSSTKEASPYGLASFVELPGFDESCSAAGRRQRRRLHKQTPSPRRGFESARRDLFSFICGSAPEKPSPHRGGRFLHFYGKSRHRVGWRFCRLYPLFFGFRDSFFIPISLRLKEIAIARCGDLRYNSARKSYSGGWEMILALLPEFAVGLLVLRRFLMETTGAWNRYSEEQEHLREEASAPVEA